MATRVLARQQIADSLRPVVVMTACMVACVPSQATVAPERSVLAASSLVEPENRGVVAYREVRSTGATFTLEAARGCKRAPRPSGGRDVILDADAERVRCRLRPWRGPVGLALRDAHGVWTELAPLHADREGRLQVRFADLDAGLRRTGDGTLGDRTALRVGRDGWAGTYDLARLREVQADLHASWIGRGRGVPALFGVLHPGHDRARAIAELAVEARLARQELDFAAVGRGELTPEAFLDRHVWSPLRLRVMMMMLSADRPAS